MRNKFSLRLAIKVEPMLDVFLMRCGNAKLAVMSFLEKLFRFVLLYFENDFEF